jgi:cob(I)alamin adenosyltransferase
MSGVGEGRDERREIAPEEHRRRAQVVQAHQRRKQEAARGTKGLLIVHTGTGKGKSSSAFGMAVRAVGHGMRVGVVQFIKSADTAERRVISALPGVEWHTIGDGFTWETQDREKDMATAARAWEQALRFLRDPSVSLVVLDELNIALAHGYLETESVLQGFSERHGMQHVVATGRGAPPALLDAADLVTEFRSPKHPFHSGIGAQAGIEY